MYRNDNKGQKYQLITTDDEENDETEDPIEPAKQSPSVAAQIETALFLSIAVLPIVAKKFQFFQVIKYLLVYHQFQHQGNNQIFLQ